MRGYRAVLALLAVFVLAGCGASGTTVRYINPAANFSFIKKVAILPFNNLTNERFAGERVRNTVGVSLISRGVFDVVEQGEVTRALGMILKSTGAEEGGVTELDAETLKLIGDKLGVQAVILGSVDTIERGGEVAISMRMLDTGSGVILWQVKSAVSGSSVGRKVIGLDPPDTTTLVIKVVDQALNTLL